MTLCPGGKEAEEGEGKVAEAHRVGPHVAIVDHEFDALEAELDDALEWQVDAERVLHARELDAEIDEGLLAVGAGAPRGEHLHGDSAAAGERAERAEIDRVLEAVPGLGHQALIERRADGDEAEIRRRGRRRGHGAGRRQRGIGRRQEPRQADGKRSREGFPPHHAVAEVKREVAVLERKTVVPAGSPSEKLIWTARLPKRRCPSAPSSARPQQRGSKPGAR